MPPYCRLPPILPSPVIVSHGTGTHYKYSQEEIEQLVQQAQRFIQHALSLPPPLPPRSISHSTWRTQLSDIWLVHALSRHPVAGQSVVSLPPSS